MSIVTAAAERLTLPDGLMRLGINHMVGRTAARLADAGSDADFVAQSRSYPIATHVEDANAQHYELPAAFFGLVLGARRKYSCCLYGDGVDTLDAAEIHALQVSCAHAQLQDGQRILELGCGWGSLSLWMAEHYPAAQIVAVSNSTTQRAYIEAEAAARGLRNLRVVTADMNVFAIDGIFDRVVSVEMFEHMSNWPALLDRVAGWLAPDGRAFVHVFAHRRGAYRFDPGDTADWIAQHFFSGGVMPSHGLMAKANDGLAVEESWQWSGEHYRRTAEDWLANYDAHRGEIMPILRGVYGREARLWWRRWRLFFLATSGLFGFEKGKEWGVSHYRLVKKKIGGAVPAPPNPPALF